MTTSVEARRIQRKNRFALPRQVLVGSVFLAVLAWVYGYFSNGTEVLPYIPEIIPGTAYVERQNELYVGYDRQGNILGYAAEGQGQGYSGPVEMLVGIDVNGEISGVKIIVQRETPGFFRLILENDFIAQYLGLDYRNPMTLNDDLDAVSGATVSAEGVAMAIRQAVRRVAADGLDDPLPAEKKGIKFGVPEVTLIGLYAAGYVGHKQQNGLWKKRVRWGTLLTGMLVLGFIYSAPFTISQVISLLSGYWPDWRNNLYWYLLIGGILFVTTVDAKNPYCHWFCPFGAVQECLAALTGAKLFRPRKWSTFFTWLQRGLAFSAVLLGLALRRPGIAGYEPFATLFDFRGTGIEVAFLVLVLLASLVMVRPFCNYLCPLDPVYDFIAESRRWIREAWKNVKQQIS